MDKGWRQVGHRIVGAYGDGIRSVLSLFRSVLVPGRCVAIIAVAVMMFICAGDGAAAEQARAAMRDVQGNNVGVVTLAETPHGTLVHARLTGLPEGTHAFHVHAVGICEPPFKSAGGHYNPGGNQHGIRNPAGLHAGDMPNIHVPAPGALEVEVLAADLLLDDALFDDDGASIVIHEGSDDYMTDPAGDAGPRIACGVIEP